MEPRYGTNAGKKVVLALIPFFSLIIVLIVIGKFQLDKTINAITGETIPKAVVLTLFISAFLLPFGVVLRHYSKRKAGINRMLQQGKTADALIKSIEQTGSKITSGVDELWGLRLELEVRPAAGGNFSATAEHYVSVIHLPQYQPEKIVQVKYDPGNTGEVVIIGLG